MATQDDIVSPGRSIYLSCPLRCMWQVEYQNRIWTSELQIRAGKVKSVCVAGRCTLFELLLANIDGSLVGHRYHSIPWSHDITFGPPVTVPWRLTYGSEATGALLILHGPAIVSSTQLDHSTWAYLSNLGASDGGRQRHAERLVCYADAVIATHLIIYKISKERSSECAMRFLEISSGMSCLV
nr:hypothetical protein CFP56_58701 [Quercus suber]